jgi:NAD(P)-dependent dehydrogenase (short-subunit alcohol dehydrogenase family)
MSAFAGRAAIVTGAGHGLGRSYARFLAAQGASVLVNNRLRPGEGSAGSADRVVGEILAEGGIAAADHGDAADPSSGERMVAAALRYFGRLDILICNAGVNEAVTFRKQDMADFRRVFEINLFGTAAVAQAAFRVMHAAGFGRILVTTSTAGLLGDVGLPAYSASKAAVIGLMRVLALEGARRGILANAIAPYATTRMTKALTPPTLHGPFDPDRVAPVAAWLVHDRQRRSGEVFIVGAGALRIARVMQSGIAVVDDDPESIESGMAAVERETRFRAAASATADFAEFAAALGLGVPDSS